MKLETYLSEDKITKELQPKLKLKKGHQVTEVVGLG